MKIRRRTVLLSLTLLLLAGGALPLPPVHWRLIGWVRGEAFFEGRPTCYWRQEILAFMEEANTACMVGPRLTFGERVATWIGFDPEHQNQMSNLGDPAALPVLHELARDTDPEIRWQAACMLGQAAATGPDVRAAVVEELVTLLADLDSSVRVRAAAELEKIGAAARPAVPALRQALKDPERLVRDEATRALWAIDPDAMAGAGVVDK